MPKGASTTPRKGRYLSKAPFDTTGHALVLHQQSPRPSEATTRGVSPIRARGEQHKSTQGYALVPAEVEPFPSSYTRATKAKANIQWQFKNDDDKWVSFGEEENNRIEHSFCAGAGVVELPGKGGRMYTYNFSNMTQTSASGSITTIKRNEHQSGDYLVRPKAFTDFSVQFVRRNNPKFNISEEGFFGGTREMDTISVSEATCSEVVSTGHVWTGEKDGTIKIWNAKTGKAVRTTEQKKDIFCSALLEVPGADGSPTVWAGFTDATIRVFTTNHPYEVRLNLKRHAPGAKIHCLVPQIGGHCVFSGGQDGQIYQWDIRTYECVDQFSGHRNGVRALIADADVLYSASDDGSIAVSDIYGRDRVEWRGHAGGVHHLVKTDRHIWSGSEDGTCRIWNIDTGECCCVLREPHSGAINSMTLVGDKVWTSSGGAIFMWSARDIGQPPVAQYSDNHIGYITGMPVIHKSVLVRVWTTGAEGEIKVWNAECSADYDPEEVLRPQLDKKKQEVCYLKERLQEMEEDYKEHSTQQEIRIDKLKKEVEELQDELADKRATLATTRQELAAVQHKNSVLENSMKRHDDKVDELSRELSIEKSKAAGMNLAHQKELVQVRKDSATREEDNIKRIARLEQELSDANRNTAKYEEIGKTLDKIELSGGERLRSGSITDRVHALIEENQKLVARLEEVAADADRKDGEVFRLRQEGRRITTEAEQMNADLRDDLRDAKEKLRRDRRGSGGEYSRGDSMGRRGSRSGYGDGSDDEAAHLYGRDKDHGAETHYNQEHRSHDAANKDERSIGGYEDTSKDALARQLAEARAKAKMLENELADRAQEDGNEDDYNARQKQKGTSLTQKMRTRAGSGRSGTGAGGDEDEDGTAAYNRDRRKVSLAITGDRPQEDDNPDNWVFNKNTNEWCNADDIGNELDTRDVCNDEGELIMPEGELVVRDDGLLLYKGKPIMGTDGSWVTMGADGTFEDGSGRAIDLRLNEDGEIIAVLLDDEEDEDAYGEGRDGRSSGGSRKYDSGRVGYGREGYDDDGRYGGDRHGADSGRYGRDGGRSGDSGGYGRDGRYGDEGYGKPGYGSFDERRGNKARGKEIAQEGDQVALGTPDGEPCFINENGSLIWQGREVVGTGGEPVSWNRGERPRDSDGRRIVGVTEYGSAILLDDRSDPIVLPVGAHGLPLKSCDGRKVVEPIGGRPMLEDGTIVVCGNDTRPIATPEGVVAYANRNAVVVGPDGKIVTGPDGATPVTVSEMGTPVDKDGPLAILVRPDHTMDGCLPPGTPVAGHDGRIITGPSSDVPVSVGPDGRCIVGPDGRMVYGPDGYPVVVGASGHPETPDGQPLVVTVTPRGRAVVEGAPLHGQGQGQYSGAHSMTSSLAGDQYGRAGGSLDRHQARELNTKLDDANDQLDRALQDLEVERDHSASLMEKIEILSRNFGEGTTDEQVAALQKELASVVASTARKEDDMMRREDERKGQLAAELERKLALIEQERVEEVNKFRDMVERRDESLRLFNDKQRSMLSHIKQLEDNIQQANTEQAMIWEKHKNPSQLPTNELIYYYKYKEEQYAKIGGLNQQLHEENGALMGQTQALTEKLHAMSFVMESRRSLLKVLYDLYKMCVHTKKTIDKFSKEVSVRERTRRELLDNIGGIRTEVVDIMNGEKWLIANMFTEYELLHLGTSPSFFVPDGKRFSKYKPSTFGKATGTGRWTRTPAQVSVTPRGLESPRTTSPTEYVAGRPASPQRGVEYSIQSVNAYY